MKKVYAIINFILGLIVGSQLGSFLITSGVMEDRLGIDITGTIPSLIFSSFAGILFGFIFLVIIPLIAKLLSKLLKEALSDAKTITFLQIIMWLVGGIIGLIIAALLSIPIASFMLPSFISSTITIIIYVLSVYICTYVASYKTNDLQNFLNQLNIREVKPKNPKKSPKLPIGYSKILDTSVIIDGRIFDILKSGFVEGPIIIPKFILEELQQIADSTDNMKRNRGRRGLDILNKIQNELSIEVILLDKDYDDITEVDSKLLKLAIDIDGKVVTNDYNLNKVAQFQGIQILNTNDLSNAVKTLLLPGEELLVKVIKEGKENSQGLGYLEDGTMIVVEGAKNKIGQELATVVTSVIQTAAGRMIFAKPIS